MSVKPLEKIVADGKITGHLKGDGVGGVSLQIVLNENVTIQQIPLDMSQTIGDVVDLFGDAVSQWS